MRIFFQLLSKKLKMYYNVPLPYKLLVIKQKSWAFIIYNNFLSLRVKLEYIIPWNIQGLTVLLSNCIAVRVDVMLCPWLVQNNSPGIYYYFWRFVRMWLPIYFILNILVHLSSGLIWTTPGTSAATTQYGADVKILIWGLNII